MQTLLTGVTAYSHLIDRVEQLTNSLSGAGGKIKPPKHIMLTFLKCLTGNTVLLRSLNRLGHGVSYTQIEEMYTTLPAKGGTIPDGSLHH